MIARYDINQAAEICDCHPCSIRKAIKEGRLIASKPGKKWIILEKNLIAFLEKPCPSTLENPETSITPVLPFRARRYTDPAELLTERRQKNTSKR